MIPLKNTNPIGHVDLPLIGRALKPGEEFEVTAEQAAVLLEQHGNYELADPKAEKARQAALTRKAKAADTADSEDGEPA